MQNSQTQGGWVGRGVCKKNVLQGVQGYGVVQEYGFYGSNCWGKEKIANSCGYLLLLYGTFFTVYCFTVSTFCHCLGGVRRISILGDVLHY
jgi:hypothetical protein